MGPTRCNASCRTKCLETDQFINYSNANSVEKLTFPVKYTLSQYI